MSRELQAACDAARDLARESLYRFLAAAFREPGSPGWEVVLDSKSRCLASYAAELLSAGASECPVPLGFGELSPEFLALRPLFALLTRPVEELHEEYNAVF